MLSFETGPIRPPSEATSILLRITRNCHWGRCAFCPVYKDGRFSLRTVAEIIRDLDAMSAIAERLGGCAPHRPALLDALQTVARDPDIEPACARQMAFWLHHGMRSLFLQDADALVMPAERLVGILDRARRAFPSLTRITSYARARTLSRKSPGDLRALQRAGLNRIHVGMESGSDTVLALVNKGATRDEQIRAGRHAVEAGIELSEYFMPGLGGREFSRQHAAESAGALSAINPAFIRIRSTVPVPHTPLHQMLIEGRWTALNDEETVREIRAFIEQLDGVTSVVQSDHIMNLLEDVSGTLPRDRAKMLACIDRFLDMDPRDRELFVVGRRLGHFRFLDEYTPSPGVQHARHRMIRQFGSVDAAVLALLQTFV